MKIRSFNISRLLAAAAGVCVAGFTWAQVPPPPGPTPTKPANKAEAAKRSAEMLASQGHEALAAGDFKAARDCFLDATLLERTNRRSFEALGYAYLKLGDARRAATAMESALAAPSAAAPGRSLSVNLANTLVRSRNPMRAAKVLKDYMAARPGAVDEDVLDAFMICLGQAGDEAKLTRLWTECVAFYEQQNAKLEATRPGEKRWGVDWIPQAEWQKKDLHNKALQKTLDAKLKDLNSARADLANSQAALEKAKTAGRFRRGPAPNYAGMQATIRNNHERAERLAGEYNEIWKKLERPTLPPTFGAVALDTLTEAPAPTAIAVATPPLTPPVLGRTPDPVPPPTTTNPPVRPPPPVRPATTPPVTAAPPVAVAPPPPPVRPTPTRQRVHTYAAGFAVAPDMVVTAAETVANATSIQVQPVGSDMIEAELVRVDEKSGLALLKLKGKRTVHMLVADAFAGGAVQCWAFPTPNLFEPEPEMLPGSVVVAKEKDEWTARLGKHPRYSGAPLLVGGKVVGVQLGSRDNEMAALPAANLASLKALIGLSPAATMVAGDPRQAMAIVSAVREK